MSRGAYVFLGGLIVWLAMLPILRPLPQGTLRDEVGFVLQCFPIMWMFAFLIVAVRQRHKKP
jgi:hypothetical protein